MKILTVLGARPQFIKAAMVTREIRKNNTEIIVHTGQHYDKNMSDVFFNELEIPSPDYNLSIGSGNHGYQTGKMLIGLEEIYIKEKPDMVLVYGDTNSTLAGALCASKLLIPIAHVEAGLRGFNKSMPEEQNRILTDHLSKYLFIPTETAKKDLEMEGIRNGVYLVGDVMYDAVKYFENIMDNKPLNGLRLNNGYILVTIHRAENTNDIHRLTNIINALNESNKDFVFPMHPRTKKYIHDYGIKINPSIKVIDPVGYFEMLSLERNSVKIVTDSGGVQKEAYFLAKPCITVRDETEWIETVQNGWNILTGSDMIKIIEAINDFCPSGEPPKVFGDGEAAKHIAAILSA